MKTQVLKNADDCIAFAQAFNPGKEHLTVEKLRTFPGCENYSDEQAAQIIQSLEQLALIIFECTTQKQFICIDNQQDVSLTHEDEAAVIPINNKTKTVAA